MTLTEPAVAPHDLTTPTDVVRTHLVTITPELAATLLATMLPNRHLRRAVVEAYARDMRNGHWRLTGESVKLNADGQLIDGEHRLTALVEAGVAVPMFVVVGLPTEVREVLDVGVPRKTADILTFQGYKNSTTLAAATRVGILDKQGYLETSGALKSGGGQYRITRAEEQEYLLEHPELPEVTNTYTQAARKIGLPTGAFVYGMSVLEGIDKEEASYFADSMANSATDGAGDPRNTLLQFCRANLREKGRIGNGEALWLLFTTWNAWRDKRTVQRLAPFSGPADRPTPKAIPAPH